MSNRKIHYNHVDQYNKNPNICMFCKNKILAQYEDNLGNIKNKKFCNSSCAAKYNNHNSNNRIRKRKKHCINCGELLNSGKKFCSSKCKTDYEYKQYIIKWKKGEISGQKKGSWGGLSSYIRRYLFEKYNYKCAKCDWAKINPYSNTIPLEIEHIDGNSQNNSENNLVLLCPNCHSLTSTYRGLNKGNGTRCVKMVPK